MKRVIELAQEAGLVFNEEIFGPNSNKKCYDWHAARLRKFAELIEKELSNKQSSESEKA